MLLAAIAIVGCDRRPGFRERNVVEQLTLGSRPAGMQTVYVPDEAHGDRVLASVRRRFAGRTAYGFGGVVLACEPRWENFYAADVPFVVRDVVRDRGTTTLGTGTTTAWSPNGESRFDAVHPLRFIVTLPRTKPFGRNRSGGNPGTRAGACPALVLADWQVDRTITTSAPPSLRFGDPPGRRRDVRIGETRADVAWKLGYPTGFEPLATVQTAPTWHYDRVALERFDVSFRHDRVVSVTDRSVTLP